MLAEPTLFRDRPCIRLRSGEARALVSLHGAQVLSWVPADGRERLFLSDRAVFDGHSAIRGGIPVILPQFGERGPSARHGFARTRTWAFQGIDGGAAHFDLHEVGQDAGWPHPFSARLSVDLEPRALGVTLAVANTGDAPFAFTAALHTYLRVSDIASVALEGLHGCDYEDQVLGGTLHRQQDHALLFAGEVDRVYADVVAPLVLVDGPHRLGIEQDGFGDVVTWNPGAAAGARLSDLAPGEWREFACVEAAQVLQGVRISPGASWVGRQRLG